MVGLAVDAQAPAPVRDHLGRQRDGRAKLGQADTLLNVEFDERGDPAQRPRIGAKLGEPGPRG